VKVEPFGNMNAPREARPAGESAVREVREPLTDVFEEDDHLLVVAEVPGVREQDLKIDLVGGDVLIIEAERRSARYRKELLLPRACSRDRMTIKCNNGVVEIRLDDAPSDAGSSRRAKKPR
jgi:HSP20 family protein